MSGRVVINQNGSRNPTVVASQYNLSSGVSQLWINVYRDENNDWVMLLNRYYRILLIYSNFIHTIRIMASIIGVDKCH